MLRTPLHDFHTEFGGQMVDFAGWEMPIRYGSILEEHRQVRERGGVFDVSHMGRVRFKGRHARRLLERLCTRRIHDMQDGQCRYSLMCNERGGIRDDVLVYRYEDDDFLVVVNASSRAKMLAHFDAVRAQGDLTCQIDDQTEQSAMVAVQGPRVMELIGKFSNEVPSLKRYRFAVKNLLVMKVTVSRTGYTGEDGVEVILPAKTVRMALQLMLKDVDMRAPDAIIKPAGLGARDTLRLEAGMPLYGHELTEETNALGAGLDFAIALDKDADERGEPYVGMEALKRTRDAGGPPEVLVGIRFDAKRVARAEAPVLIDGARVGRVTSGALSPTLNVPIAMAYLPRVHAAPGVRVAVDIGSTTIEGEVVAMPFYSKTKG